MNGTASTAEVDTLERSLDLLESYLGRERLRGYDPYDALTAPIFSLPFLRSSKWPRFAAQQALRRMRWNVRPLLRIRKGYNAVTVAFVLEGAAYRAHVDAGRAEAHRARAEECVRELSKMQTTGRSGACWGYPFDWEARYAHVP